MLKEQHSLPKQLWEVWSNLPGPERGRMTAVHSRQGVFRPPDIPAGGRQGTEDRRAEAARSTAASGHEGEMDDRRDH